MYKVADNVIIVECSILSNDDFKVLLIYGTTNKRPLNIQSFFKKRGQLYINNKCIGKYITTIDGLEKKSHIYFKIISERKIKPSQTVFLPSVPCNFKFNIYGIKNDINTEILYKHLFL
jgi:hypothetical protein